MTTNTRRPADCFSEAQTESLETDAFHLRGWWIMTEGHRLTIAKQAQGEEASSMVTIPKAIFDEIVEWYMKPQKI